MHRRGGRRRLFRGTTKPSADGAAPVSARPVTPPQPPWGTGEGGGSPAHNDARATEEAARAAKPPQKTFEELVVSADSVIGLQTETPITSERARIEDRVEAR